MAKTRKKSPLTNFEKLSPNRNKPRTGVISRLTPHHVAGNLTAMATLSLPKFQNYDPVNGGSCNYAIGSDGQIGLGVEETNRAWTSSSGTNDHQAITCEIANDGGAPDWHISDAAINAWMDLSVEQCRFYGFKKINYQEKPANITIAKAESWIKTWATDDAMTITLHNWFSSTACPGPYFMANLPWMVSEMNRRLADSNDDTIIKFPGNGSTDEDNAATEPPVEETKKSVDELAKEVIAGKWGNAPDRAKNLTEAGYDSEAVQAKVNEFMGTSSSVSTTNKGVPYEITITANALNIRKGAGTDTAIVKTLINDKNVYTIIEEKTGPAGNGTNGKWGKLKSGIGWVLLAHTKKR